MSALPKKAHWPPAYIYFQSAVIALVVWWFMRSLYQDDAYITLVYARNWLEGHGLVWSRGDEPVEGYSNFLFLLLIAGLGWLGMDLVLASRLISFVAYFGLIAALFLFTRTVYRQRFAGSEKYYAHQINSALAVGLVASAVPVLAWVMGGLETVLFTFLLTSAVCSVLYWLEFGLSRKRVFLTGVLFALATMTRLEGLMVWGMTGIVLGLFWLIPARRNHLDFSRLMLLFFGYMLLVAPWMAWKFHMYGDFLPNTYYAKVYGIPDGILTFLGWLYMFQVFYVPPFLLLAAVILLLMYRRFVMPNRSIIYLIVIACLLCWHVFTSGGDHMPYLRFYAPIIPLLCLLIYYCCASMIEQNEARFRDISGAMIVLSVFQLGIIEDLVVSRGAVSGTSVAAHIEAHWKKGALIAINPAGALPYYAPDFRYVDMLALNDKHTARLDLSEDERLKNWARLTIGHLKTDGVYVLSRKPDYIMFGEAWGDEKPRFMSDVTIAEQSDFQTNYRRVETFIDIAPERLEQLREMDRMNQEDYKANPDNPRWVRGPVVSDDNKLRFIYYERIR
ncbi:MAG: hypothetical protein LW823_05885 [Rickettsiales bacterium]|jgi:arabinofuranosyltransferase|nr:hypothetical protein [Rickettsiales bacterium]